ncbi:MAG: NfeD family protein [Methanomassiliicoccaceae archaeon]|nr:NfeD family protein [Methanomassiliicoccaceae archaeon]
MVDVETLAIIFIIAGAVLLIAEAMSPGVFLLIPGTVLVILGIIGYFYPDFLMSKFSPILAVAVAIPVTVGTVRLYQMLGTPEPPTTTITETLIGREGVVTVRTVPESIKGKVRIGTDTWSATSSEPIEAGTEVKVIKSEGVHVTVIRK